MGSGVARVMNGSRNGTGATLTVRVVGFRPRKVEIINSDGDIKADWNDTMADDSAFKITGVPAAGMITTLGITPLSDGFQLGADTDLNVDGELFHWTAWE
jgi:hypothetical protein